MIGTLIIHSNLLKFMINKEKKIPPNFLETSPNAKELSKIKKNMINS